LKLAQVAVLASRVLLALQFSSSQKMVHTHNFVCHQVKLEMLMFVAAQQWELLVMQNNQISIPEKLDVRAGKADAQLFAVLL
jgi:hypothetical protein